jgi:hypothetical protein
VHYPSPPTYTKVSSSSACPQYQNYKLIYRRYAGLYFSICVDVTDNELAYLECIHLFVELLDEFFRNVCELDIVFNFNKVRSASTAPLACRRRCQFFFGGGIWRALASGKFLGIMWPWGDDG